MTPDITRLANALYRDAEVKPASPVWIFEFFLAARISNLARRIFGGLWVGGTVTLSEMDLRFVPNGLNQALHRAGSINPVRIMLSQIIGVHRRFGVLTDIVDVTHPDGIFTFRCFAAKSFAAALDQRRGATQN